MSTKLHKAMLPLNKGVWLNPLQIAFSQHYITIKIVAALFKLPHFLK